MATTQGVIANIVDVDFIDTFDNFHIYNLNPVDDQELIQHLQQSTLNLITIDHDLDVDTAPVATKWGGKDLVTDVGFQFGVGTAAPGMTTLTYSFSISTSVYAYGDEALHMSVRAFQAKQQEAAEMAMACYAAVANIKFEEVTETNSLEGMNAGDIRWSNTVGSVPTAHSYLPRPDLNEKTYGTVPDVAAGDIWFGPEYPSFKAPTVGSYAYATYIHELGHSLGLVHPHEGIESPVAGEDQLKYSVMSYRSYAGESLDGGYGTRYFPTTLMLNDILAIQYLYGVNYGHENGDNVYKWDSSKKIFETIWDSGGDDTLSAEGQKLGCVLNLNPGEWSEIGVAFWNGQMMVRDCLTIAYGCEIENATGSSYDDKLIGNKLDNALKGMRGNDELLGDLGDDTLEGGDGNDTLEGGEGDDTLEGGNGNDALDGGNDTDTLRGDTGHDILKGGKGQDHLYGGTGDDVYYLDYKTDLNDKGTVAEGDDELVYDNIFENDGEGIDEVRTDFWTYALGAHIENLTFYERIDGSGEVVKSGMTGYGNELDNVITGASFGDRLYGYGGRDTLIGGAGFDTLVGGDDRDVLRGGGCNDTYVVNLEGSSGGKVSLEDQVIEEKGMGIDTIVLINQLDTALSTLILGANIENLDASLTGATKLNLTGNALANELYGNDADNVLDGGKEVDKLWGGLGDDTYIVDEQGELIYISGENALDGGGTDTIVVKFSNSDTKRAKAVVLETTYGPRGEVYDNLSYIENVRVAGTGRIDVGGNSLDNHLTGNGSANVLLGKDGNDTLVGGEVPIRWMADWVTTSSSSVRRQIIRATPLLAATARTSCASPLRQSLR